MKKCPYPPENHVFGKIGSVTVWCKKGDTSKVDGSAHNQENHDSHLGFWVLFDGVLCIVRKFVHFVYFHEFYVFCVLCVLCILLIFSQKSHNFAKSVYFHENFHFQQNCTFCQFLRVMPQGLSIKNSPTLQKSRIWKDRLRNRLE